MLWWVHTFIILKLAEVGELIFFRNNGSHTFFNGYFHYNNSLQWFNLTLHYFIDFIFLNSVKRIMFFFIIIKVLSLAPQNIYLNNVLHLIKQTETHVIGEVILYSKQGNI